MPYGGRETKESSQGECKDENVVLREILFTVAANCNAVERSKLML